MNIEKCGKNDLLCIFLCISKTSHSLLNIYIFIAIALDETSILVALHFSVLNIYQSYDLGHAVRRGNVNVSQ